MERELLGYLARYGTPVVFVAQVLGIFGLPIPDELLLTMAGVLMRRGELPTTATLAAAIAGCMAGVTISYVVGRTVGHAAVRRFTHGHEEIWVRAQRWFRRFGGWLLTFGFFIPGVRHVTAIAAGTAPMDYATFSAWTYPGAALWATTFVALGYYAGDRWREMVSTVRTHAAIVVAAGIVVVVVGGLWSKSKVEGRGSRVRGR